MNARTQLALLIFTACSAAAQVRSDPATVARGRDLFASSCGFCHGPQAMGTEQAPPLARNRLVFQDQNGEMLEPIIKTGRPSEGMPAFPSLTHAQIMDIASFLHARAREIRGPRVPEEKLLVGDAKAGEAYFKGTGNCATCHSPTGDMKGIANKYSPLILTTTFLTPRPRPVQVKAVLSSGETLTGVLVYADEFVVSFNDASGEYQSLSRSALKSLSIEDPLATHKKQLALYSDDDIHNLLAYLVTLK